MKIIIIFDTSFLESLRFNFDHPLFNFIQTHKEKVETEVILHELMDKEINSHLIKHIEVYRQKLFNAFQDVGFPFKTLLKTDLIDMETLKSKIYFEVSDNYNNFKKKLNIQIIDTDESALEETIERYFNLKPPFSEKKKQEFFDSIALINTHNYIYQLQDESTDIEPLFVSTDLDWASYCNEYGFQCFKDKDSFQNKLNELFKENTQNYKDLINSQIEYIKTLLRVRMEEHLQWNQYNDIYIDYELIEVLIKKLELTELIIIDKVTIVPTFKIHYSVEGICTDPDSYYDGHFWGSLHLFGESEDLIDVKITLDDECIHEIEIIKPYFDFKLEETYIE